MDFRIKNKEHVNKRIDLLIPLLYQAYSRSQVQKLIKAGHVFVNGNLVKANYLIQLNDGIHIEEEITTTLMAENIPLEIVYEDDDLLVINK